MTCACFNLPIPLSPGIKNYRAQQVDWVNGWISAAMPAMPSNQDGQAARLLEMLVTFQGLLINRRQARTVYHPAVENFISCRFLPFSLNQQKQRIYPVAGCIAGGSQPTFLRSHLLPIYRNNNRSLQMQVGYEILSSEMVM